MSLTPDDEPTIVPLRPRQAGGGSPPGLGLGVGNTLPLGTRLGEFEIIGLVGEGGFGIVYLARDHALERNVALKEYMPSTLAARGEGATVVVRAPRYEETFQAGLRSFINEARLLARFDHPSLVKVYRFWDGNGTAYMVMPFYDAITLKALLRNRDQRPDEDWLKNLLRPLTDALDLLHQDHCFHRDIAPDNILMLDGDRPLLLDFGAARRVIGDMTHDLTAILKPGYAPVEQYAEVSSMKQGAWTDIYALASVVHFAIMGKPPDPSVARLISDPVVPLARAAAGRYSDEFLRGIDKALSVRPQDRPQSIAEFSALIGLADRRRRSRAAPPPADNTEQTTVAAPAPQAPMPPAPGPSTPTLPASLATGQETVRAGLAPHAVVGADDSTIIRESRSKRPIAVFGLALLAVAGVAAYFMLRPNSQVAPLANRPSREDAPVASKGAPTPAGPTAALPPFTPELMLRQVYEGRDPQRVVTVSIDAPQARVGKDALRFSVTSSTPGYLYVLALGTRDSDFQLLFPNAVDKNTRFEAGEVRKLPGPQWSWPARGPVGTHRFVAIVSDEPRDFVPLGAQEEGAFRRFPLETGARLYRDYAGRKPLYAGQVRCVRVDNCSTSYGAAAFSIDEVDANPPRAEPAEAAEQPASVKHAPVRAEPPPRANSTSAAGTGSTPECVDILQRASLGEPLSARDRARLEADCR